MDAVELLLGHSHLLGWNLRQAHTHERGRGRRPALILRPRLSPTDRSNEHESASDRGAYNCAIHCRRSLGQFCWRRHISALPGRRLCCLEQVSRHARQWTGRMGRSQSKCSSLRQGQGPTLVMRVDCMMPPRAARLDISKCDYRYPLHACRYRQVRRLSCPRRARLVFAGKMVAAAGVYPSASHGP